MSLTMSEKKQFRFRILTGMHAEGKAQHGTRRIYRARIHEGPHKDPDTYTDDIIQTDSDLRKMNREGSPTKFEMLDGPGMKGATPHVVDMSRQQMGETAQMYAERMRKLAQDAEEYAASVTAPVMDTVVDVESLRMMSKDDLKQYASECGISVDGARTKEEMIGKIVEGMKG